MSSAILRSYRAAFAGLPRQVWVLAACLFVNRLGMMVLPFLELYLTGERALSVELAGRLVSLYGVGAILGVTAGGWLTDRLGPWRVQVASLLASALMLLLLWRARSVLGISVLIVATSFASDTFRPANAAAISAAVGPELRARAFSLMSLAVNLGLSVGLPLAGLLARSGFDWLFWIDAGTAAAAALVLWRLAERIPLPPRSVGHAQDTPSPWRDRVFLLVVALQCLTGTVLFQFFGALPVFLAHDIGFDEAGVGWTLALNTLVTAAFGMLVVRWVERRDELRWIGLGSFLICAGYGVNGLAGGASVALLSVVVWSVGEMLYFPLGAAFASRRAPAGAIGRYMSVYHLGLALALVLAPWIGTLLYARVGPRGLWASCALTGVFVAAVYAWLRRRGFSRPPPPVAR